jgi:KDO2-lipid IV(A) lauroyltransferase
MTERPEGTRALRTRLVLALAAPLAMLIAYLPLRAGLWLGARLGDLAWIALPGRRAIALDNLARALGEETTARARARIGRDSFRNLGMNAVEACVFYFRPPHRLLSRVEVRGVDNLVAAAALGRGVLALTAHLGNWELLAAAAATLTPMHVSIVYRPLDDPVLDPIVDRFRSRVGVELIGKRNAVGEMRDALRRGRLLGVLLDQNASRREGVFAPFFGVPASTSRGFALIALRAGAPVVPSFIRRAPGGRHIAEFGPMIPPPPTPDVEAYTRAFNAAIEAAVRRAPGQWFWVHRRWKTRPPEPAP